MNAASDSASPTVRLFDIEDDLNAAARLNDLIDWIEQARQFIKNVGFAARDERVFALLQQHSCASSGPEWSGDHEGLGLFYAHRAINDHLRRIAVKTGIEKREQAL